MRCDECNIRVPAHRPVLICSICVKVKHYKCNNLSKTEAFEIINRGHMGSWACRECMTTLFPANIDELTNTTDCTTTNNITVKHTIPCTVCNNPCSASALSHINAVKRRVTLCEGFATLKATLNSNDSVT